MEGTGAVGKGMEGTLECLQKSWIFAVGSGESSQQGRDSHRWTLLSPHFASLSTLETKCSLVVGREKLALKIKQAPGHPLSQEEADSPLGKAGIKLIEKAMWMLGEPGASHRRAPGQLPVRSCSG